MLRHDSHMDHVSAKAVLAHEPMYLLEGEKVALGASSSHDLIEQTRLPKRPSAHMIRPIYSKIVECLKDDLTIQTSSAVIYALGQERRYHLTFQLKQQAQAVVARAKLALFPHCIVIADSSS